MDKYKNNWSLEKDIEEKDLDILIDLDLADEDLDPDLQQYHLLAKKGLA